MTIFWLLLVAIAIAFGWVIRHNLRKWDDRKQTEEERLAKFMEGTAGVPPPTPAAPAAVEAQKKKLAKA